MSTRNAGRLLLLVVALGAGGCRRKTTAAPATAADDAPATEAKAAAGQPETPAAAPRRAGRGRPAYVDETPGRPPAVVRRPPTPSATPSLQETAYQEAQSGGRLPMWRERAKNY